MNMVRIITGTLLEVGTGKLEAVDEKNIDGEGRALAGPIAQLGLMLKEVNY